MYLKTALNFQPKMVMQIIITEKMKKWDCDGTGRWNLTKKKLKRQILSTSFMFTESAETALVVGRTDRKLKLWELQFSNELVFFVHILISGKRAKS